MRWLRLLWPIPAMLAAVLTAQAIWAGRYPSAVGHAAEHLSSATAVFGIAFLLGVVLWGVGSGERRQPALWLIAAVLLGGAVVVANANASIVDAIGGEDWSYEQAELLGPSRPGFTAGHELAAQAAWFTVGAAIALAVWLGFRKVLSVWVCAGALVLSLLVPSWIFPGAGLVVLAIALVVRRVQAERSDPSRGPASAAMRTRS